MTLHDIQEKIDRGAELLDKARMLYEKSAFDDAERLATEVIEFLEPWSEREDLGDEKDNNSQKFMIIARLALAYNRLNVISIDRGAYPLALQQAERALHFSERIGNSVRIALLLGNIGIIYMRLGNNEKALEYYHKALPILEEQGNKKGVGGMILNIGMVYEGTKNHEKALENYRHALSIFEEIGEQAAAATATSNIGIVYGGLGEGGLMIEYCMKALGMFEDVGEKFGISFVTGNIGGHYAYRGNVLYSPEKAEEYQLKALQITEEIGSKPLLSVRHKALADFYEQEGEWEKFAVHYKKYHEVEMELINEESKKQVLQFEHRQEVALLQREQEVTDMLLHKFLPSPIVAEVKQKGDQLLVERYDSVSILFADLVGFTKLSLKIPPTVMVEMLNLVFTHFDTIIKNHGGHRLRTMGDGYFAILGAPDRHADHTRRIAQAALDMQAGLELPERIMQQLPAGTTIQVRIGLNCGEAVCGLVGGLEKWQYDAYGDTVNTASRMESHGVPGKIHCTEEFKHAVETLHATSLQFIRRGDMEIKGKGMMSTYFLEKATL